MSTSKNNLIQEIISAADEFDRRGDLKTAELLDQVLKVFGQENYEEFDLEIPQDEKDVLEQVLKSLQESLK